MSSVFTISYFNPAEPRDARAVDAAVITWQGRTYPVQVQAQQQNRWLVVFNGAGEDVQYVTYRGAVTAAHLNAYLYATDLVETVEQATRHHP